MKVSILMLLTLKLPFQVVTGNLNLHSFENFEIEFNVSCSEYLHMYNSDTNLHMFLNHVDDSVNLTIICGQSYEVYGTSLSEKMIFGWPIKTVNFQEMTKVNYMGNLSQAFVFNATKILCPVLGYSAATGTLVNAVPHLESAECEVYKCPKSEEWKIYIPLTATFVLIELLLILVLTFCGYNGSEKTLLRQKISRFIQRISKILQRSEESLSECQKGDYSTVSESRV